MFKHKRYWAAIAPTEHVKIDTDQMQVFKTDKTKEMANDHILASVASNFLGGGGGNER